jgi:hypothetical protein
VSRIKWRNLALFALTLVPVLAVGDDRREIALVLLAYTGGVLPCAFIVWLGWFE